MTWQESASSAVVSGWLAAAVAMKGDHDVMEQFRLDMSHQQQQRLNADRLSTIAMATADSFCKPPPKPPSFFLVAAIVSS